MAVTKITWENKTGIQNDTSVARKNKVTDEDMNEIKQTVNNNADELNTAKDNIEDLQGGQGTVNADITSLKNRVSTLETDNTQNKSDISTLKSDNQTNKSNISTMQGQISDIQQEQQTQNTNIEELQENDIEQDLLISKLKNALLNAETEEAKSLHVTDANRFGSLEVLGNHEQETRSGKNKLNLANIEQTTKNGIAATYNKEDGSVTFNGTCTADNTVFAVSDNQFDAVQNQTTLSAFYVSGSASSSSENDIVVRAYNTDWSSVTNLYLNNLSSSNSNLKIVIPGSGSRSVGFRFDEGVVLNNFTIKCMVTSTEAEATGYEQYGASPSPDYPSKVVCLGSNKNLLHMQEKNYTQLGVNVTQKESCLTLNGTTNAVGNLLNGNYVDIGTLKKGKYSFKAHMSGDFERQSGGDFAFYIRKKSDTSESYGVITGSTIETGRNSFIFELTEDTDLVIQFFANVSGIIFNNFEMKLKVEEGTEATSYSPYNQGSTKITKINKNWFDKDNLKQIVGIANYEILENGIKITGPNAAPTQGCVFKLFNIANYKGETFTIKAKWTPSANNAGRIILGLCSEDGSQRNAVMYLDESGGYTSYTIPENLGNTEYLTAWFYANVETSNAGDYVVYEEIQIELGNTATDYIEHEQIDYILDIQQEMLEGDYFVREADGWKEVHYRPILTFTGEEDWLFDNNNSRAYINLSEKPYVSKNGLALSNYFTTGNTELSQNCFYVGSTQLFMKNLAITTLDAWKAWLAQQNEAGMPIKVYYVAETPTKLPCTPEQSAVLEELSNLDLFDGVNNIITAENIALLKLKYSLDVKTYVNNQLANVNQQILEIVGGN